MKTMMISSKLKELQLKMTTFFNKFRRNPSTLGRKPQGMPWTFLINLAISNIRVKKTRTAVTVGGMAIAIGVIVLLVSFGFGLQELVIDRAVELEEMRQVEVSAQAGSRLVLNQETLIQFSELGDVQAVLPQILVVGKVTYQGSVTDVAIYAVTSEYLEQSALIVTEGEIYADEEIVRETGIDEEVQQSASKKELMVNESLLRLIGLEPTEAVAEELTIEITVPTSLLNEEQEPINDTSTYTIVGVVNDTSAPLVYMPFADVRGLGVVNYSQIKVVATDQDNLPSVRRNIEALGFATASVADTVEQINSIFSLFRILLFAFGLVALVVASLGMFNTLTVSLLERTREIGLMKAFGMSSREIRALFLIESVLMGIGGGILGLILGIGGGKLADVGLSMLAVSRDTDPLNISYVPFMLAFTILLLSIFIGLLTGIYPAIRATKISALDALRYE